MNELHFSNYEASSRMTISRTNSLSLQLYRLLFLHEGKVVWQGMTDEFTTSNNPIVRQVINY